MKYLKNYFNSHKKIILLIILLILVIVPISYLLTSYATNILATNDGDDEYTFTLTEDDNTISVAAHSSVTVFYNVTNTNNGTVKYGIGYSTSVYDPTDDEDTSLGVYVKGYSDNITALINENSTATVKLKIFNQTDDDDTVTLSTVLGYETGGNLIPDGVILVEDKINEANSTITHDPTTITTEDSLFLGTGLARKNIAKVTIVNNNIVPAGFTNFIDISPNEDKSIIAWWEENTTDNTLMDVYIGSDYGKVIAPSNCKKMFAKLTNVTSIDLSYLNTLNVETMKNMFYDCSNVLTINLSTLNTSNVTDMYATFYNCSSLNTLDLSNFNTTNTTDMSYMFMSCSSLSTLNLSNFDSSALTTTASMFSGCTGLTSLNLSGFDFNDFTTNSTTTTSMFNNVTSNITVADTSQKTAFESIFTTYDTNKVLVAS